MMTDKRVAVTIDRMGNTKVEAQGFMGVGCEAATAPIERALGVAGNRDFKGEYHMQDEQTEQQQHVTF